jgi:type IV pilus assembly protein PilB
MDLAELEKMSITEVDKFLRETVSSGDFRVSEVMDTIIQKAVMLKTSDIHMEPTKRGVRIRCRVDGCFQNLALLPTSIHDQLISRLKVLADLITHQRSIVQEGRITFEMDGRLQDLRLSIVPTVSGENAVLRMFSSAKETFELDKLGYERDVIKRIVSMLFDLNGMILLTGPSGSGKTTTLYSLMLEVVREMDDYASMITIEDPVEYEFGLFPQMQVDRNAKLDFAAGLSAVLRQDPEVIMVGEIRDTETAEVGLRAALTGHLVLSTIHAGSACETVARLINMGLEPFIVASALSGVIAQRLVRRVCQACKEAYEPDRSKLEFFAHVMKDQKTPTFYRGKGCEACDFTSYRGRLPVAELLEIDDELRSLILSKAQTSQIRKYMATQNWTAMVHDGLTKVAAGNTTIEEIFRVVSLREVI